jgi:CheY-like chemotaxis protein
MTGKSLLVVEDDEDVRTVTEELLLSRGYDVAAAANGNEALNLLAGRSFDALLTDVVMPGMTGFELAGVVRAQYPGIRVVCMSGYSWAVQRATVPAKGALRNCDAFLQKPWSAAQLEEVLARLFRG